MKRPIPSVKDKRCIDPYDGRYSDHMYCKVLEEYCDWLEKELEGFKPPKYDYIPMNKRYLNLKDTLTRK